MLKLKRSLILFFILPFALFACTTTEEPAAVDSAPVVEEVAVDSAESMSEEDSDMDDEDHMEEDGEDHDDDMAEGEMTDDDMAMGETVFAVDAAASTLTWTGAKAIGDSHTGTIDLIDGELVADGESFVSGMFTIDMTTISESAGNARLEGHLKSDDFFGVETYPTASLEIVGATPNGSGGYDVVANLTMKESTNELTFPVTVDIADGTMSGTASIVFDRSLWDVQYGSGSFFDGLGDDLINDEIELEVSLVANN